MPPYSKFIEQKFSCIQPDNVYLISDSSLHTHTHTHTNTVIKIDAH